MATGIPAIPWGPWAGLDHRAPLEAKGLRIAAAGEVEAGGEEAAALVRLRFFFCFGCTRTAVARPADKPLLDAGEAEAEGIADDAGGCGAAAAGEG